ncbi:MAG: hypothetical protein ACI81L_001145 [Verrucomicrobiales bacterium]|jgi:hypothetical protein
MTRVVFLAFSLLSLVATSCGSPAARELGAPLNWTDGSIDPSDQTLRINFVGSPEGNLDRDPCAGEYEAIVEETPDTLIVTIHQVVLSDRSDDTFCSLVGNFLHIDLAHVLDGRTLIDGATGKTKTPA